MLFLLVLLPVSINCMYLFISYDAIHTLVLYSCAMLYVFFAFVAELALKEKNTFLYLLRQFAREGIILSLLVITGNNIYVANEAYLNMHMAYENTYAVTNSVMAMVQDLTGYTHEEPIAILGTYQPPEYYEKYFSHLERLVATCGISPTDYSASRFWEYYCGMDITSASEAEMKALQKTEAYLKMPAWPDAGCVQRIGDVIAVKFS